MKQTSPSFGLPQVIFKRGQSPVQVINGGTGATQAGPALLTLGIAPSTASPGSVKIGTIRINWGEVTLVSGNNIDFTGSITVGAFAFAAGFTPLAIATYKEVGGSDPRVMGGIQCLTSTAGINFAARNNVNTSFSSVTVFWVCVGPA